MTEVKDKVASDVRRRAASAVSDLYAADASYHRDCSQRFISGKSLPGESNCEAPERDLDVPLHKRIDRKARDMISIWS